MRLFSLHPRRFLLVLLFTLAGAASSRAESVSVPRDGSGITIDVPAGWTSVEKGDGYAITSPSGTRLEFNPLRDMGYPRETARKEAHQFADAEGMTIVQEREERTDTNPHGINLYPYRIEGKARGQDRVIGAAVLLPFKGNGCVLHATMSAAGREEDGKAMDTLFHSFRSGNGAGAATSSPAPGGFKVVPVPPPGSSGAVRFPADGSSITMSVPPGWTATLDGTNLRVQTDDKTLTIVFLRGEGNTDPKSQLAAMARALAASNGVTDTKSHESEEKSRADEHVRIVSCDLEGRHEGREFIVAVAAIIPEHGQPCLLETVIDTKLAEAHKAELNTFVDSFKSAR